MSEADRAAGRGIGGAQRVRLAVYPYNLCCAVAVGCCTTGVDTIVYVLAVESDLLPNIWRVTQHELCNHLGLTGGSCGLTSDPKTLVMYRSVRTELEHFFIFGMD